MPPNKILVDSSFLIALYDKDSNEREVMQEIAQLYSGQFLVPQVVLTEVVYLLKREAGVPGAINFLDVFTHSQPDLQDVIIEDLERVQAIMQQYADAKLDFVDCCIMALSERLNITQVCTLDQRDFSIFRPKHCDYLEILP
ncbi:MAG: PIN domain-containing protein [Chloroflexota bacterium]